MNKKVISQSSGDGSDVDSIHVGLGFSGLTKKTATEFYQYVTNHVVKDKQYGSVTQHEIVNHMFGHKKCFLFKFFPRNKILRQAYLDHARLLIRAVYVVVITKRGKSIPTRVWEPVNDPRTGRNMFVTEKVVRSSTELRLEAMNRILNAVNMWIDQARKYEEMYPLTRGYDQAKAWLIQRMKKAA